MGVCRSTPPFQTQKPTRKADSKALARRFMFFKKVARVYMRCGAALGKPTHRASLNRSLCASAHGAKRLRGRLSLLIACAPPFCSSLKPFWFCGLCIFFSLGLSSVASLLEPTRSKKSTATAKKHTTQK